MKKNIFVLLLSLFCGAYAVDPVFTANFEENFIGRSRGKKIDAKVSQELLWETLQNLLQPGLKGNAAVIGTSADKGKLYHAVYKNDGILNPFEGTVSFWVKPVNWSGQDKDFHVLFQASGPDSTLLIYKYINSNNLMFLLGPSRPVKGKYLWSMAGGSVKKWNAGEWHHIAAAYDRKSVELFIDGKRVSKILRSALPQKSFTTFSAGAIAPKQWKTSLGMTLLDELQIFDSKLSYSDIAKLSAQCGKAVKTEISRPATIVDRKKKTLHVYFTVEGIADKCRISFLNKDKKVLFRQETPQSGAQNHTVIDLAKFQPGKYLILLEAFNGKISVCRRETDFTIPKLPEAWRKNSRGKTPVIPVPWKGLKKGSGNTVSGTVFAYEFENSPLPRQITAGGTKLFSRPAELVLNGRKVNFNTVENSRFSAEENTFTAKAKEGSFNITADVTTEFDGFTWVKLTLDPGNKTQISSLKLDFPFKKTSSTLFNSMNKFYMNYQKGHVGKFKNYNMNLYKRPPVMFVGNDNCGLQWFCEKLPCWYNDDKETSLQLLAGKKENLLRLNLVDHKISVDRKLVYEFGFQSVPIRPMPENWRSLCPYRNFDPYFVWSKYHHYPYADALRQDKAYVKLKKNKTARFGKNLFYYFAGFTITPTFPEWSYYKSEWMLTPPEHGLYGAPKNPAAYFTWICPNSEEYRDFYLDRLEKIIRTLDINHIYIDNSDAQLCDNARHGCGYTGTDGKRYTSFNLHGTRTLARRVYTLVKNIRPDGRVIRHMSAKPVAPVIAFADMIVDGELYNKTVALDESYFNIFEPEMFRASFCGKLWGIPQFFIPQFTRVIPWHNPERWYAWKTPAARQKYKVTDKIRHFKGYFLLHDTQIFPLFGVKVDDIEDIKQRFGLRNETRFISYASSDKPWSASAGVLVSGYIENGRLMLIALNESSRNKAVIKFDAAKLAALGVKVSKFVNAETNQQLTLEKQSVTLDLKHNNYIILTSEK